MSKPVVAIVGRPNVGKSALFNRITGKQISLVYDRPGVTRDRITHECAWEGKAFTLIDTGGIGLEDESGFEAAIQREVEISLGVATDLLLVVDGREGVMPLDREIARRLRRAGGAQGPRVLVAVNKMDSEVQRGWETEFVALGWPVVAVSAAHGRGMEALMGRLTREFPDVEALAAEAAKPTNVAIVGRPNSGKSSLINALLAEDRVIVSPIAGTTRDAVDISFERNGRSYLLVDTAGMRRRARVHDPLEQAMASRSAHSINRAEVCLLVVDAVLGISDQEKKIAGLIQQARKPCAVVVNKWDLAAEAEHALGGEVVKEDGPRQGGGGKPAERPADWKEQFQRDYEAAVRRSLFFLTYAPVVFASAKEREGMEGVCRMLEEVGDARRTVLPGGPLNRLVRGALERHAPVAVKGRTLKIFYVAQQREGADVPTLTAFINRKALWTEHYQRYLEQKVREAHPLPGCPLVWKLKDKEVRGEGAGHRGERNAHRGGLTANPPAREARGRTEEPRPQLPVGQGAGRKPEFPRGPGHARRGKTGPPGRGMGKRTGGKTTGGRYRPGKGRTRGRGRAGTR